jgi:hypothetical protein
MKRGTGLFVLLVFLFLEIAPADDGLWGGLTSWTDTSGTRSVLQRLGAWRTATGSIVFRLANLDSKPVLNPLWTVKDLIGPVPPVVAIGVEFI